MNDEQASQEESSAEPLFILRYNIPTTIFRIVWYCLITLIFAGVVAVPGTNMSQLWHTLAVIYVGFFFLAFTFWTVDMILFKEIHLYQDRIVKVWRLIGQRQIKLSSAKFSRVNYDWSISNRGSVNRVTISDRRTSRYWASIKGIHYDEGLADWNDVKKLNRLLESLSAKVGCGDRREPHPTGA